MEIHRFFAEYWTSSVVLQGTKSEGRQPKVIISEVLQSVQGSHVQERP